MTDGTATRAGHYAEERRQRDERRKAVARRELVQWLLVGLALLAVVGLGVKFYFWLLPAPATVASRWGTSVVPSLRSSRF